MREAGEIYEGSVWPQTEIEHDNSKERTQNILQGRGRERPHLKHAPIPVESLDVASPAGPADECP